MQTTYQDAFARLIARSQRRKAIASRLEKRERELAWKLAASVEIPQCMCCLHNASIDHKLEGWCHNNMHRLVVAKCVVAMFRKAWRFSTRCEQQWKKDWNRLLGPFGISTYP